MWYEMGHIEGHTFLVVKMWDRSPRIGGKLDVCWNVMGIFGWLVVWYMAFIFP